MSLAVNVAAAGVFIFSRPDRLAVAGVMFVAALVGGVARRRGRVEDPREVLRWLVVVLGVGLAIVYFARL